MNILNEDSVKRTLKNVKTGNNVVIYDFVNAYRCTLGDNTKVGAFVEIQQGVLIGSNCKISSHTFICEGVTIEDNVFIGHGVLFINDKFPCAVNKDGSLKTRSDWHLSPIIVKKGASIGTGAVIMCGVTIGENALVGAGAVLTKNVPPNSIATGNPAVITSPPPPTDESG
jgi:acetyltransferase-like isoleucine patch superfamily enzyme